MFAATSLRGRHVNSLAPGRFQRNLRKVIFQLISVIDGWSISCKIVLKWMPMDLVQVMAWCHQATSHYLKLHFKMTSAKRRPFCLLTFPVHLKQCWLIINWNPHNKIQWTFNHNTVIFFEETAFQNDVCKTASISFTHLPGILELEELPEWLRAFNVCSSIRTSLHNRK